MRVHFTQAYIEVGVNFPFSPRMQSFLGQELSSLVQPTAAFAGKYGADFDVGIYISARKGLLRVEIKGPTVNKRGREVEYTVFLPYDTIRRDHRGCRAAVELLVDGVLDVLRLAALDSAYVSERREAIVERVCSDPTMLSRPWPATL